MFVVGNTEKLCEIFGIRAFKFGRAFCHSMLPRVFGIGVLLEWSNVAIIPWADATVANYSMV